MRCIADKLTNSIQALLNSITESPIIIPFTNVPLVP